MKANATWSFKTNIKLLSKLKNVVHTSILDGSLTDLLAPIRL